MDRPASRAPTSEPIGLQPPATAVAGIGRLNEKPLHASLRQWYARPGDRFEVPVGRFVIDIVRDDLLIEIQMRNFASIKSKLSHLLRNCHVRVIYPLVQQRWIIRPAAVDDSRSVRRRSPRRGRWEDVFRELVSIPELLSHPRFSLEVLMIREEETRRYVGRRQWRRRGWAIEGRRLLEVVDRRVFAGSADWRGLLPHGLDMFTTSELATAMNGPRDLAQKMAYCLRQCGVIAPAGKQGRANLYRLAGL